MWNLRRDPVQDSAAEPAPPVLTADEAAAVMREGRDRVLRDLANACATYFTSLIREGVRPDLAGALTIQYQMQFIALNHTPRDGGQHG